MGYPCNTLPAAPQPLATSIRQEVTGNQTTYTLDNDIPNPTSWLETLAGPELNWLRALLTSRTIVQGKSYIDNPIRRLLAPRPSQRVVITRTNTYPTAITFYGAARSHGVHKSDFKAVEIEYQPSLQLIDLTIYEDRRDVAVPLYLQFRYVPSMPYTAIYDAATLLSSPGSMAEGGASGGH